MQELLQSPGTMQVVLVPMMQFTAFSKVNKQKLKNKKPKEHRND
jgi:NOL1/NOP2/fmu family ribosome biogenesis protein